MSDGKENAKLLDQYDLRLHIYDGLLASCERLLSDLFRIEKLRVVAVTGRVKERLSLSEKLSRPGKKYDELPDVTDLVGLRVVTFFEDDVDRVAGLLTRELELVPQHCVDKRAALEPDRFGYRSLHYVCRLPAARRALFENSGFQDQVVEIQIRSILQHAWAEIEHDLGYKGEITIPNEIKRQLSGVASLLEIADRDFREVRDRSSAYRQRVTEEISRNELSGIDLDVISYSQFVLTSPNVRELNNFLSGELGYTIDKDMSADYLLRTFQFVGIGTIEKLKDEVEKNFGLLKEYARIILGHVIENEPRALPGNLSLFHLAQIVAFQNGGIVNLVRMFTEFNMKSLSDDDHQSSAQKAQQNIDAARMASQNLPRATVN